MKPENCIVLAAMILLDSVTTILQLESLRYAYFKHDVLASDWLG